MGWINFGAHLVATAGLYACFKWLVKLPTPTRPRPRSCLKKPAFLDSVQVVTKTLKKAARVLGWKGKVVTIQATPTKSRVVSRWIDKKVHCFHRKRRQAPKRR